MADIQSNIQVNIDTQEALASIKRLQAEISAFQTRLAKGSADAAAAAGRMQQNLIDSVNMSGKFAARMTTIQSTTESFTNALEKNKLSLGQYFRYAAGSTETFGKRFKSEFATIDKVARERVKDLQTQYISMGRDANGALRAIAVRPLALDLDNLGTRTAIAAQKQQIFNQLLRQGSTNLLNFGKNTQWAGRQLMVGFTIPLSILGTTAGRVFMEMEEAAIKFRKVYGDLFTPTAEREQALKDIEGLGAEFTKYGIAVADTISLAAEAAAAGFSGAALQAQTAQATRLSVLGQIDQQKALETTIALQNAFRISTEDLADSINFLNAVENQTVISLDDITSAIPRVAPVIQQLGGDVKDLSFFLAAMKESGISAEQGANALKSGLASLINPSEKARQMLLGMGVDIKGIVERNVGDLAGTVSSVAIALDKLDPLQRAQAIEQLFGKFQFARISALFDNISREGTQAQRVLDLAGSSVEELASITEGELAVVSESTGAKFKKAVEDIRAALAPVGEDFLKIATPIIEFGTKILDAFNGLDSGVKRVILGFAAVLGGLGPVALMTFGLMANGVANVIKFFAFLRERMLGLGQQSNLLAEQTSFMTQEQLNAAAVASSLDQTHSKLIQTFNVEKSSLAQLRHEYEKLIATQNAYRGPIVAGGKTVKPKSFASGGIVSGPGTGTSDSIAAMISNGEAIIPAAMVKKYGPLIQGIIADEIPGFKDGTSDSTYFGPQIGYSQLSLAAPGNLTPAGIKLPWLSGGGSDVGASVLGAFATDALDQKGLRQTSDRLIAEMSNLVEYTDEFGNILAKAADGAETFDQAAKKAYPEFLASIDKWEKQNNISADEAERMRVSARRLLEPSEADLKERRRLRISTKDGVVTRSPIPSTLPGPAYRTKGQKAAKLAREFKGLAPVKFGRGADTYQMAHAYGGKVIPGTDTGVTGTSSKAIQAKVAKLTRQETKIAVGTVLEEIPRGVKEATAQSSPSKKARQAGANIGVGAIQGIESQVDDAKVAGTQIGTAVASGAAGGGRGGAYRDPQTGRFAKRPTVAPSAGLPAVGAPRGGINIGGAVTGLAMAATTISSMLMFAGGELGDFAGKVAMASGAIMSIGMIGQMLPQGTGAKLGQMFTKLAAGVGGFARLIPMMIGWGALIVGAGAALVWLTKTYMDQKKQVERMGQAAGATADQLNTLGSIFGVQPTTALSGQEFGAADAIAQTGTDGVSVQSLRDNEQFLGSYKDTILAIQNATDSQAQSLLMLQAASLQTAGFGQEAIDQIVTAIALEAGRTDLNLNFRSINVGDLQQNLNEQVNTASKIQPYTTGYSAYGTVEGAGTPQLTLKDQQQIQVVAGSAQQIIDQLNASLAAGTITQEDFNRGFDEISQSILGLDSDIQGFTLEAIAEKFDMTEVIDGVDNTNDALLLLKARASGVKSDKINQYAEALKKANAADATPGQLRTAGRARKLLSNDINGQAQAFKNLTQAKLEETAAEDVTAIDSMIAEEQQRIDLTNQLVAATGDAALAVDIMNDATLREMAFNAAAAGTLETDLLPKIRELLALKKEATGESFGIGGSGGGAKETSALDSIVLSLRNVYDASIQTTEGFKASSDALQNLFGGTATESMGGLEQQLRGLGASEDLIELIIGMPPEEFNKYKKQLFNFDAAGKSIIGLGAAARNAAEGLRRVKYAEYINDQKKFVTNTKNQITAMNRLTAAGVDYATAYEMVQDTAAATVIATAQTAEELAKVVDMVKQVQAMTAKMEKISANAQAVQSVKDSNKEFKKRVDVLQKLAKAGAQYTSAEIEAILADPDLQTLFLNPKLNKKALQKALDNAAAASKLEIKEAMLTEEGRQQLFEDAQSKIEDMFATQENAIAISFRPQMAGQEDIVRAAERDIADLQQKLDDSQAGLEEIRFQETEINDRYQDRFDALQKVAAANQRIAQQQKAQLGVADALAQGDIAAAARAAADLRAQQAKDAADMQKENLQRAKEAEIASLTSRGGKTKEQLDQEVRDLQQQILIIEEDRLEPAKYAIDLINRQIEDQTLALTVLGKTRDEWDAIANATETATQKLESYQNAISAGLGAGEIIRGEADVQTILERLGLYTAPAASNSNKSSSSSSKKKSSSAPAAPPNTTKLTDVQKEVKAAVAANAGAASKAMTGAAQSLAVKSGALSQAQVNANNYAAMMIARSKGYSFGGMVKRYAAGGFAMGSDTISAMLTPGEFVVRRPAVNKFGVDNLEKINSGAYSGGSVYNYSLSVNVRSDADPQKIANTVMAQIKRIDNQKVRGNRF